MFWTLFDQEQEIVSDNKTKKGKKPMATNLARNSKKDMSDATASSEEKMQNAYTIDKEPYAQGKSESKEQSEAKSVYQQALPQFVFQGAPAQCFAQPQIPIFQPMQIPIAQPNYPYEKNLHGDFFGKIGKTVTVFVFFLSLCIFALFFYTNFLQLNRSAAEKDISMASAVLPMHKAHETPDTRLDDVSQEKKGDMQKDNAGALLAMYGQLDERMCDLNCTIEKLRAQILSLGKNVQDKKEKVPDTSISKQEEKKSKLSLRPQKVNKASSPLDQWHILGYSGTRVVIEKGGVSHFLRIGQSLDGIVIEDFDAEKGTIKTSAGIVQYQK